MAKSKVIDTVKFMERCLKEGGLDVSRLVLFGSHAKGGATAESDIDVVIISKDFRGKDIFKRAEMTKDAEVRTIRKFLVPLDVLTMTPEEWKDSKAMLA